jgi:hypothetical protein
MKQLKNIGVFLSHNWQHWMFLPDDIKKKVYVGYVYSITKMNL